MFINRVNLYFIILLSAKCFGSLYHSRLHAEVLFILGGEICNWPYCCQLWDLALHIRNIYNIVIQVVARPSLLYGSDTWVTTERDITGLEAAEMRVLRSVTGYARLDKIRSEVIRKELEISGIQDVRLKYKQNWINHL